MANSALLKQVPDEPTSGVRRRLPIGAEYQGNGTSHVRVWAPAARDVAVVINGDRTLALRAEAGGYFRGSIPAVPGDRYQFRLGDDERLYPDPASRYQPDGPHAASQIVDPSAFHWTDSAWRGVSLHGQVIYELHLGTFTPEGTFEAAAAKLPELADVGITIVELMPVAEFDGRFGWGYDGVDLFAPFHRYGVPDDFRRFVDAAHGLGIAVILDVVYNHFGPVGNYLRAFSPSYFTDKYENEWGDAINFDGEDSTPVRELVVSNAGYWIDEYHLDGLRLDATQQIFDASPEHVLTAIGRRARDAAGERSVILVAENEPQETRLVKAVEDGGYGLDGLWNDDFHHSAIVALTGRREAYYTDTYGQPQEFVSAAKYGYLFQGQHYSWQRKPRGTPSWGLPPYVFVAFLQNHDQVANSVCGLRGHRLTSPGRWRAMTALLLLGPATPMLFQGQEFQSSAPFLYFADFDDRALAEAIKRGRAEFLSQFPSIVDFQRSGTLDDPGDPSTFERCTLDWKERETNRRAVALHRDLSALRRADAAFAAREAGQVDGCVLSASAFALRFFTPGHADDRLLVVNLGSDLVRHSFSDPLMAPPEDCDWVVRWSSEHSDYGGLGTADPWSSDSCWHFAGESAIVLSPGPCRPRQPGPKRRTA